MVLKQINAFMCALIIVCASICAQETQSVQVGESGESSAQKSVVWYKKRSTRIMAALAATAVGIYALAVRHNKIAGPIALFTALFCCHKNMVENGNGDTAKIIDNGAKNDTTTVDSKEQNSRNKQNEDISHQQKTDNGTHSTHPAITIDDEKKPNEKKPIVEENPAGNNVDKKDESEPKSHTEEDNNSSLNGDNDAPLNQENNSPLDKNTLPTTEEKPLYLHAQDGLHQAKDGLVNFFLRNNTPENPYN